MAASYLRPVCNRCAIQSIVITLCALNRAAIFTLNKWPKSLS